MNEFDRSKVILIGGKIEYIGNINDNVLHIISMKNYGQKMYGIDSEFSMLNAESSPNLGIIEFIKRGKIVFLNLSRFGEKYALVYFPSRINSNDRVLLEEVLSQMVSYEVVANFCDSDVDENLLGYTFRDSYDEGFYEIFNYLEHVEQKNKGL